MPSIFLTLKVKSQHPKNSKPKNLRLRDLTEDHAIMFYLYVKVAYSIIKNVYKAENKKMKVESDAGKNIQKITMIINCKKITDIWYILQKMPTNTWILLIL